jgi:inosine-uridine nucleoside N-ribohydrolase
LGTRLDVTVHGSNVELRRDSSDFDPTLQPFPHRLDLQKMWRSSQLFFAMVAWISTITHATGNYEVCEQPQTAKRKVIIDSDMGWDDVLSTLYLMKKQDIEIVGVCVTGRGETNLRWGTIIAQSLMGIGNQVNISIGVGTDIPFDPTGPNYKFPQGFRNDMNDIMGLLGTLNPDITIPINQHTTNEYLTNLLLSSSSSPCSNGDRGVTILSIGGFTNLANLLEYQPCQNTNCIKKIENVYAMAGAVFVDGNVQALNNASLLWNQGWEYSSNYKAEWNVFIDPMATKKVFESEIPLTLIPLDACDYVLLNAAFIEEITCLNDPLSQLAQEVLEKKTGPSNENIPVPMFDPVATVVMATGIENYDYIERYLDVVTEQTPQTTKKSINECGKTFVHKTKKEGRKIKIVQGVSSTEFSDEFKKAFSTNCPSSTQHARTTA